MGDGEWVPAFPGQRPPFARGHLVPVSHGAKSPRLVGPLAEEIERAARADESWPAWLSDPSYARAVEAWAWAEAVCERLRLYLAERDFDEAISDRHTEESVEEQITESKRRRRSSGTRTRSALDMLAKWESIASNHRSRLGLDAAARARMGRDIASGAASADLARILSGLDRAPGSGDDEGEGEG